MACALCGLGAPPVLAQQRAGPETAPALIGLSPQVYAVPDVPADVPVDPWGPEANVPPDGSSLAAAGPQGPVASFGLMPGGYAAGVFGGFLWLGGLDDGMDARDDARFSIPSVADSWSLGARSWRYTSSAGYGVTLGNELAPAPSWSQPVRLAGVGVYRSASGPRPVGGWRYAAAAGKLDDAASTISSGGLAYGPAAYDVSSEYTVAPGLSLASQAQGAPDLFALGLGGEYSMRDWGSWALGVSRAQQALGGGWRYQMGYEVDAPLGSRLSWINERRGAGYSDLSSYHEDPFACDCVRNRWGLSVPLGRWGRLSGTYERRARALDGLRQQTVGLAQRFSYGPRLKVRLEANGDVVTGAYGLGARFSLPID